MFYLESDYDDDRPVQVRQFVTVAEAVHFAENDHTSLAALYHDRGAAETLLSAWDGPYRCWRGGATYYPLENVN